MITTNATREELVTILQKLDKENKSLKFSKEKRLAELKMANIELAFQNSEKEKRANELSIASVELSFQNEEKEKRADELIIANKELIFQNSEKEKRSNELIIANEELSFQNEEKEKRADELIIANKELAFQNVEKEKRADELIIANKELAFQNSEKEKRADELIIANKELAFQNSEKEKRADELIIANQELSFQNIEKEKRADELIIANQELSFQNIEKGKRADELSIANIELAFQNVEKEKRADELSIANVELDFQNIEKEKRADELVIANKELAFQNIEKEKRADELSIANVELAFQNSEKEKRADELIIANKELAFQNSEKEKRANELIIANQELSFQNTEKEKRADELIIANQELLFQNIEKGKRADELSIANIELAFQNVEKEKRADELNIANVELDFQNIEKEKRADELVIANKELAFQNIEKEKRADELSIANVELDFQNIEKEKRADELSIANIELAFQNIEKEKRADELSIANIELAFQNIEKEKRAEELMNAKVRIFENIENEKLSAELVITNKELVFQNEIKEKRATALTIAKEHAEESEKRFRILMQNMEAGIIVYAPDTSIVLHNTQASEILGLTDDQMKKGMISGSDWKFVKSDKSPLALAEYPVNRIKNSKKSIKNQVLGIFSPAKDSIIWLTVNGFPMLTASNDITEIVISFIDITDKKRIGEDKLIAKLLLEKIQNELLEAQKLAHIGSWVFNPLTKISEWSVEMFNIWGLDSKKGAPEYASIVERIHSEDVELFTHSLATASSLGTPYNIEFRIYSPKGEHKNISAICQPLLDINGTVLSLNGTNQDISAQKSLEESLVRHERLKAIGEMSSSIAHDFNNSLQGMIGHLEIAKLQSDLSDRTLERLNIIGSIIADVTSRVVSLQHFGDTEYEDKNSEPNDFNVLIAESLQQSQPLWKNNMEKAGFKIAVLTDFGAIPQIKCNRGEIKSALHNLIKNSIEAMPEGGQIQIKTGIKTEGVFATFTDTGIGMDNETKLKVFQPFYSTKGFKLGRGLGMSGVYSIVKKYGGDIFIKYSELDKGTTIEIIFPIYQQDENNGIDKDKIVKKKEVFNILWVDDERSIRETASELVEMMGHKCDNVDSGLNALKYLDENTCDIVFTDIGMPEMNGWELAEAIRIRYKNTIKIVVVSGWRIDDEVKIKQNIDFVLQKPFTVEKLRKIFINI